MRPIIAVDFETHAIGARPRQYPPEPVGVAVYGDGYSARYLAWGHPQGNNSTVGEAKKLLKELWRECAVVFHHSAFDCEVGTEWLGLTIPEEYHDTLFLAFLIDPRSEELSLKPLAERYLGIKSKERDALKSWIEENIQIEKGQNWGAYISLAPGELVGRYAVGDVTRTYKLFKVMMKEILRLDRQHPPAEGQQSMLIAYRREIALMPVILKMESAGIPINVKRLEKDLPEWGRRKVSIDKWIVRQLGGARQVNKFAKAGEKFNVGSSPQLARALGAAGKVSHWVMTPKGNPSVAKKALEQVVTDKKLLEAIQRRTILETYIDTYGKKWLTHHDAEGCVHPRINQVRNRESDTAGLAGTRTGRLSYSDSWHGVPSPDRRPFKDLPNLREYIVPRKGQVILQRDYTQQEFRILAHYEAGPLLARYQKNPFIDMHEEAKNMIKGLTGIEFDRRPVKDTGFGLIYGMGLESLARRMKQDKETAKTLKTAYLQAIPGLPRLIAEIKRRCGRDEPIRTWGGRLYWVEPSKLDEHGNLRNFDYKMVNVLIQGSAADCTKEAMIRTDAALDHDMRLVLQVHDELLGLVYKEHLHRAMKLLREAMESVEFDVLMLSDGKWSAKSWGAVTKYEDKREKR